MSYTLRGRIESRFAAGLLPLLAAGLLATGLREWWPVVLALLMLAVGVLLDASLFHRLIPYQPGWAAVPLGIVELAAVMGLARLAGVEAPLLQALGLFAGAWLVAQLCGHAFFPRAHLTYGEDGGELGRAGRPAAAVVLAVVALTGGVAWVTAPPTVRLEAGVHRGPLVLDHAQKLVGEPGAIVEGGIVITADDVQVRGVEVVGGSHGIEVRDAKDVVIEDVVVRGAELDGISARQSEVAIRDCTVRGLGSPNAQGIDISFALDRPRSSVEGCVVEGGSEGIVAHFTHVRVERNRVTGTSLRGITVTEMSMAVVEENTVEQALGIGIFCSDYSHCEIAENRVVGTRPDHASGNPTRMGFGIFTYYGAMAALRDNVFAGNGKDVMALMEAEVRNGRPWF
jgi:hypothetical protein